MTTTAIETIWDAVALRASTVSTVKAAYGTGEGGLGVRRYPEQPAEGPVAIVDFDGADISHGSQEVIVYAFRIHIWVPLGNAGRAAAVAALAPVFTDMVDAFDSGNSLGGLVDQALIDGADAPTDENTPDGKPWIVLPIRCAVTVEYNRTHVL